MKIAESVVRFPPYIGGVEQTVYHLGRNLVRRGHRVRVVCADEGGGTDRVDGIEVVRLPYFGKVSNTNLTPGILAALLAFHPDLVHIHLPTVWFSEWGSLAARIQKKPLVLTYHNDIYGSGAKSILARLYNSIFLKWVLHRTDRIVVSHREYAKYSIHLRPFQNKITAIPWGVDTSRFSAGPDQVHHSALTLSFLSILDRQHGYKGLDLLLDAMKILKDRGMIVLLNVGGKGEELSRYRQLVSNLNLEGQVTFSGFVPDESLPDFYRASDLFVLPSTDARQEGFGLVLLEALACGCPVLTTSIVGVAADIQSSDAGVTVPPGKVEALCGAMESLAGQHGRLKQMGIHGRKLVETRYTWERVADDYERLFLSLIRPGSSEG
ncbi:MAG TPA: glycosyltransferase family 4 protein [Thermoanaerobaculia bacterium]|nr:glycosyltransferase family 4 protein [Thermoanaerobaculia bacterium]HUM28522.1 glycosyltransferase family 4 protein [Thermoanaerobaculia bacterium]HXK66870.1 glycosyltransferase family 4 protein [Thermoanaerobaculia bacterium]